MCHRDTNQRVWEILKDLPHWSKYHCCTDFFSAMDLATNLLMDMDWTHTPWYREGDTDHESLDRAMDEIRAKKHLDLGDWEIIIQRVEDL